MSCKKERHEAIDTDEVAAKAQQESTSSCPCGRCPKNVKWFCMAGLAAGLGLVAFRAFRRASASS